MGSNARPGAQPYVPGLKNDVFISYCHGDNVHEDPSQRGWITDFGERLRVKLKQLLGEPAEVWWDKRLGGDHALDLEIKARIESTAVFLGIVSPLYLKSEYCTQEREWFLRAFRDKMLIGSRMRGMRVVKTPKSDGSHRGVFHEGLGFEFFVTPEDEPEEALEFLPASREYQEEFGKVCRRLKGLLETLRRQQVAVYVSQCSPSLKDERGRLAAELTDKGYQVLPDIRIDSENVADVAGRTLRTAQLSVHLFGTEAHELSMEQARIAIKSGRPMLVWTSQPELHAEGSEYGEFLLGLMKRSHYLDKTPLENVKTEVLALLEPREQAVAPVSGGGKRRIYILCNRADSADSQRAWELKRLIMEQDHFEVDLPEIGFPPEVLMKDHQGKLAGCEGLLLYWGQASKDWFETSQRDLGARQFRSGAIALGDPVRSVAGIAGAPVIPFYPGAPYQALEPFLEPLRH